MKVSERIVFSLAHSPDLSGSFEISEITEMIFEFGLIF